MLERITKLLLTSALVLQIMSPAVAVVSANEVGILTNVRVDDPTSHEDYQESTVALDIDEKIDSEIEDEVLNEGVGALEDEIDDGAPDTETLEDELDDEVEDVEAPEDEAENTDEIGSTIPQASIDAMRAFIENNSRDNPFFVPTGLTFLEAINALDWGEGITVRTPMSGSHLLHGAIFLTLNDDGLTYDDQYGFFEVALFVLHEGTEMPPRMPQASIDAIRAFVTSNSVDNPLIIPAGLTFDEAINALDWGDGITVGTALMSELGEGQVCGIIVWHYNKTDASLPWGYTSDDSYGFMDTCIYYVIEDLTTDQSKPPQESKPAQNKPSESRPALPQTGSRALNASLMGGSVLGASGLIVYLKNRKKVKD